MDPVRYIVLDKSFWPIVLLSALGSLALLLQIRNKLRLQAFPLLKPGSEPFTTQPVAADSNPLVTLYEKGYKNFKNSFHRVSTPDGDILVVPNVYLDEVQKRPDSEISVLPYIRRAFESGYTKVLPPEEDFELVVEIVKLELTRRLAKINPQLNDDVVRTIRECLPSNKVWTSINAYQVMLRAVAIITGSVFFGPDLCRRPEYICAAVEYTVDVALAGAELKTYSAFLKPLVAFFSRKLAKVRKHRSNLTAFLKPIVEERKQLLSQGLKLPEDALTWIIRLAASKGITGLSHIVNVQLTLLTVSIHTTAFFVTRLLYDLAAQPETAEELRAEIRSVLSDNGGVMTTKALYDMKLTDSFMKECQRLNPPALVSFTRHTEKPITLKDGTHIPANTYLEASNANLRDPLLYPDPERFDAHRFYRMRTNSAATVPQEHANREQWQFSSATREHMVFGVGRHACPGRFFASNEIKLILARILLEYDVKMPEGVEGPYPNVTVGTQVIPELHRDIMIRRIEG